MPHRPKSTRSPLAAFAALALASTAFAAPAFANEFPAAIPLSPLNGSDGVRFQGVLPAGDYGIAIARAGDVNADGFEDLVVGAPTANSAYVVYGNAGGFPPNFDLAGLNGNTGFEIPGAEAGDRMSHAVAGAGDVNGDGFADVAVTAPEADGGAGAAYVVFGSPAGFPGAVQVSTLNGNTGFKIEGNPGSQAELGSAVSGGDVNGDGLADVIVGKSNGGPGSTFVVFGKPRTFSPVIGAVALNGTDGFRVNGATPGDGSGAAVAYTGDVNGDGFGDFVIGAPGGNESHVVFGTNTGFASVLDLAALDGSNGFRLGGASIYGFSGSSVASAGDVNGDGLKDILVGEPGAGAGTATGAAYLVFGRTAAFPASLDLATLDGATGVRIANVNGPQRTGFSVGGGDVNGDGFSDAVIGAPGYSATTTIGGAGILFGKPTAFASAVDLSSLDGTNGFRLTGVASGDYAGLAVTGALDFNADGLSDVGLGADPDGGDGATAYAVFGRAPDAARTRAGSAAGQYISGGEFADTLSGLAGNDELEGRGGGDALMGGQGRDAASYAHAPDAVIADLTLPAVNTGDAAGDSYSNVETLIGSRFADTLRGNASANVLVGGAERDSLTGGGGADTFKYEKTSDSPYGPGRDRIVDFNAGDAGPIVVCDDESGVRPVLRERNGLGRAVGLWTDRRQREDGTAHSGHAKCRTKTSHVDPLVTKSSRLWRQGHSV